MFTREDEGHGLAANGPIILLVSLGSILTLSALGARIDALFAQITAAFSARSGPVLEDVLTTCELPATRTSLGVRRNPDKGS